MAAAAAAAAHVWPDGRRRDKTQRRASQTDALAVCGASVRHTYSGYMSRKDGEFWTEISIRNTNGSFDSCAYLLQTAGSSHLHESQES